MNVVFVNYHDFTSNSAVHVFNLANELAGLGHGCAVAVPGDPATISLLGEPRFQVLGFGDARKGALRFPDGGPPTLVHAWTPRELVRELTEELASRHGCPYVVHLEDNEDVLTADTLGLTVAELHASEPDVPPTRAHPQRMRSFLARAAGMTAIVDRLLELRPDGVPAEVVWPAFEPELFDGGPPDPELRRGLGIEDGEAVLVYAGNAHGSNAAELRTLYLAVAALNRVGRRVRLVRLGRDYVRFVEGELAPIERHVVRVPLQPRSEVPRYLRLADVLVQPGRPSPFNDYRLPAKLPEFFATGRPVLLPETNVGRVAADGEECLLLRRGDALEIAAKVERVLDDDALRDRLSRGARAFAERSFSWPASARTLLGLYDRALDERDPLSQTRVRDKPATSRHFAPSAPTPGLRDFSDTSQRQWAGPAPPQLGYATVRDWSDSVERLPLLATANRDLKDVQRPWALKAIAAVVPPGSRLLEIGAGEPLVAGMLAGDGYDVTVVDPYDGRDGGPSDVEAPPGVTVIRGLFPRDVPAAERFDCVYSISVLEHLPAAAIDEVCAGIRGLTREGGHTIHAVDHVLLGAGADDHLARLRRVTAALGVDADELDRLLEALAADPDAYFLSAESHNRWRGAVPYDQFPMRRCVSIQLCLPLP